MAGAASGVAVVVDTRRVALNDDVALAVFAARMEVGRHIRRGRGLDREVVAGGDETEVAEDMARVTGDTRSNGATSGTHVKSKLGPERTWGEWAGDWAIAFDAERARLLGW